MSFKEFTDEREPAFNAVLFDQSPDKLHKQ